MRGGRKLRQAEYDNDAPARPIILAGDFNALPDTSVMHMFAEQFVLLEVDNHSSECYSHAGHHILIDHILVSDPRGVLPPARAHVHTDVLDDLTDHFAGIRDFRGIKNPSVEGNWGYADFCPRI